MRHSLLPFFLSVLSAASVCAAPPTTPVFKVNRLEAASAAAQIGLNSPIVLLPDTAVSAGGTAGRGVLFSSTANFGLFFGSGAPTLSAARGSLYLRSDGTPYYNTNGTTGWTAVGAGGGGTPGGSDTQVQFNDGSAFGGDAGLTYDKTSDTLTAGNIIVTAGLTADSPTFTGTVSGDGFSFNTGAVSGELSADSLSVTNGISADSVAADTLNGALAASNLTGTVAVSVGGTGQSTYSDGQLLIGKTTGATLAKATLTGTSNQIVITNGSGTITLSTPQDIGTGSSPTFAGLTLTGAATNSAAGAASTPASKFTGAWFAGGSATTTKPQLLIEPAGATTTAWSTSGTGLGVNSATGFTGLLIDLQLNGSTKFNVHASAFANSGALRLDTGGGNAQLITDGSNIGFAITRQDSTSSYNALTLGNLFVAGGGTGALVQGGTSAGAVTTSSRRVGKVSSIADNTATTVLTITVPNAAHSANVHVTLAGTLGAGGAIGANEATQSISYDIGVARTAGVAMNAVISTAYGSSGSVAVAGAATIAVTAALTLNAEGVGVSNTASLKVTIAHGSGSSTNHTCMVMAEVLNSNATGVTISIP